MHEQLPVLFFDGECAGCNNFVRWLFRVDKNGKVRAAPLQGQTAQQLLGKTSLDSIILFTQHQRLEKSEAVLRVCAFLPFPWKALSVFLLVPRVLRDRIYDFVALRRQSWSKLFQKCELLSEERSKRVLK